MKRINLSVDLENNEVFEQEIKETIRAQVRNIVREEGAALVRNEAENEARRLFGRELQSRYISTVRNIIKDAISEVVQEEIKTPEVSNIILAKITERLDPIIKKATEKETQNVESRVYSTFTKIMTDELNKHFRQILGK